MREIIWQFDIRVVLLIALLLQTYIAVTVGSITYRMSSGHVLKAAQRRLRVDRQNRITSMLISSKDDKNNYDAIEKKLIAKGYKFYYNNMEPYKYIEVKAYSCIIGIIIGMFALSVPGAILGAIIGYLALDIYTEHLNKRDSVQIQDDIRIMMAAFRVQSSTNVFITDTITESYYEVNNPRFKQAILDFTGGIRGHMDINEACDILASKFEDKYIDNLIVVIKQLFRSGKSVNMLERINKQILALQKEMIVADKRRTEMDQVISMFLIFVIILMYVLSIASQVMTDIRF